MKRFNIGDKVWFIDGGDLHIGFVTGYCLSDDGVISDSEEYGRECIIDTMYEMEDYNAPYEYAYWCEKFLEPIETVPTDPRFYDT